MTVWLNVGCGPHRAPDPWVNLDVLDRPEWPAPDRLVDPGPLPYDDGSVDRIYAGHILEHVPLSDVSEILADWRRVLAPDGVLCVVGPDVERALDLWHKGRLSREDLWLTMEHTGNYLADEPGRHKWNCTPGRVLALAEEVGLAGAETDVARLSGWPLVSRVGWQFAALLSPSDT